ncbi:MAG: HAD family hydrolase [Gammaproteobacteria bacterium]|nr:HAD family hydrolase [Gammaproteobacteria bacterium]MDP2141558.1 HAD family hydrolase [Gammaproteobacteria bacterium]MDP2346686.1 HAD family hydrolase [Gammaproteobacteria bacterium]
MRLAIFDLDNTLLGGDSDHSWGDFLIGKGLVDAAEHKARNDHFYYQYQNGGLNMVDYVEFAVGPIKGMSRAEREALHRDFMRDYVEPMILPAALKLLQEHRDKGDFCLIVTATNRFITEPIAQRLGVDALIATDLEMVDDCYTGKVDGIPSFQAGKVVKLDKWLSDWPDDNALSMDDSIFYSDSFNDLPLLEKATRAVAVDPDARLQKIAQERSWEIISLR